MHKLTSLILLIITALIVGNANASENSCSDLLNFERETLTGKQSVNLCNAYRGKVLLVVNVASKCGFTYQYEGLEKLHSKYQDKGLVVLGFPSNDFANQEPGSAEEIAAFCRRTYGVNFPMFAKSHVARGTSDPLYRALADAAGEYPGWNFHKYLIDRNGKLVGSYDSRAEPLSREMLNAVETLL